ncbi:unnamed protein product [Schistosoma margrebowiei]|uniref:Uncharacterized protein n=1 Tax=Schistosoma margrebowiei TaxID=48269 RepID=A0A183LPI7_9TREM|nr:unnamed protein product [Schistosoma margrebowiei]
MKTSSSEGKHGIQWIAQNQLNDLDFADDLALRSNTHEQMRTKTASVAVVSASIGLNIHKGKTRSSNTTRRTAMRWRNSGRCRIAEQGGSDADVKARISKARAAFLQLKNICKSKQL